MLRRSISPKSAKCKHCKKAMPDGDRRAIHELCVMPWLVIHQSKQEAKRAKAERAAKKAERASDKVKLESFKKIPYFIKAAQKEFNAWIRLRDNGLPCICCGNPLGAGDVGGAFDCGHYRSTGSASHLRFDERNAHAQRKYCNRHGAGRAVDYRIGLIGRIGLAAVESLESSNTPHKWTREELIGIRNTYRAKLKTLKAST